MVFHYTTPAKVRELDALLDSASPDSVQEFTDAVINSATDNHTKPHIDRRLGGAGFAVPFTEDDSSGIIAAIAAMWTAAELISGDVAQFAAAKPEKADSLKASANAWLDQIIAGELYISHPRSSQKSSVHVEYDEQPEVRPDDERIVGYDGTDWQQVEEVRESKSNKFYVAHTSDPHFYVSGGLENFRTCIAWLNAEKASGKNIVALVVSGDLYDRDDYTVTFEEFLYGNGIYDLEVGAYRGCGLDSEIVFLPSMGNWDPKAEPSDDPPIDDDPFSEFIARYPDLYKGNEYYAWTYKDVKILSINDISDYTAESGSNPYFNCNPPGAKTGPPANPDHSGITDSTSGLNVWMDEQMKSWHPWKIIVMHRPLYATRDDGNRRLNIAARPSFANLVDQRLSEIWSGDLHLCSITGPWYQEAPNYETLKRAGQRGVYEFVAAGGYLNRERIEGALPDEENSILFESGRDGMNSHKAHVILHEFEPGVNIDSVVVFEAWRDNEAGAVVFNSKVAGKPIVQNRGA